MGSGQGRPPVVIGDSITAGWDAYRTETSARRGFRACGIPGQIRAGTAGAPGIDPLGGIDDITRMAQQAFEAGIAAWIGAVMPSGLGVRRPESRAALAADAEPNP